MTDEAQTLTKRQRVFAEGLASGLGAQQAYRIAGYQARWATSHAYRNAAKADIKAYVRSLVDRALPRIVKNDIALAKLPVHKGEGLGIPPSLIEGAKSRIFDRSSLGPVIRKVEEVSLRADITLTSEERARVRAALGLPADHLTEPEGTTAT